MSKCLKLRYMSSSLRANGGRLIVIVTKPIFMTFWQIFSASVTSNNPVSPDIQLDKFPEYLTSHNFCHWWWKRIVKGPGLRCPQTQVGGGNHKGHMGADSDEQAWDGVLFKCKWEPRVIRSPVICDLGHLRLTVRHEQRTLGMRIIHLGSKEGHKWSFCRLQWHCSPIISRRMTKLAWHFLFLYNSHSHVFWWDQSLVDGAIEDLEIFYADQL